jgi:hypothetical protein
MSSVNKEMGALRTEGRQAEVGVSVSNSYSSERTSRTASPEDRSLSGKKERTDFSQGVLRRKGWAEEWTSL